MTTERRERGTPAPKRPEKPELPPDDIEEEDLPDLAEEPADEDDILPGDAGLPGDDTTEF